MVNSIPQNNYADALSRAPWRIFAVGIVAALAVVAILMAALMQAPVQEITTLMYWLSISSLISLALGYILYRRGLARSPSLSLTLVLTYGWAGLLTLANVWLMSEQMFFSKDHDLILSGILLLFAAIIATTFGIFVAASVTDGLRQLARTAQQIAEGNLKARVSISGRDEVAMVGSTFNEMAAQLQQTAQEREELEQMRKDLIAWTSHDLRTPLTSIRAMIEALHDGVVDDPETVTRYYKTIRSDIIALNDIIDDLFELAQLDAGGLSMQMADHALGDLVSDTLEMFQALALEHEVTLRGTVAPDLGLVRMCAPKIGRVIANLVNNALRYTPAGGTVVVTAVRQKSEVIVTVQDSGSGFAKQDLERVFEQFYRGEQARSRAEGIGAGLGLAIAKGIVTAHNGRIWAENAPEGGAIVGFSLPDV
ncbi:sensor histidine kinase [Candidatus Leptofilum sp.]|uniref:sensor histidine kinase n=1 Tax=Candidatus Leptofilum sp. TaxID=3241576 RepID=UPI003B59F949